jgi:ankyrin repeat protein
MQKMHFLQNVINKTDSLGRIAVQYAIANGDAAVVVYLLAKNENSVHHCDHLGFVRGILQPIGFSVL